MKPNIETYMVGIRPESIRTKMKTPEPSLQNYPEKVMHAKHVTVATFSSRASSRGSTLPTYLKVVF